MYKIDSSNQEIVIFSDGMGSNSLRQTKYDETQKLYRVGSNILTATGRGDKIIHTLTELMKLGPHVSTTQIAQGIKKELSLMKFEDEEYLRFFLGGYDNGSRVFEIANGGEKIDNTIKDIIERGTGISVDGSGSQFT